ncbi:hypothetical protein [Corynebacterium macginleyi]
MMRWDLLFIPSGTAKESTGGFADQPTVVLATMPVGLRPVMACATLINDL